MNFEDGQKMTPGMKLIDAVKAFGEACQFSWTPEDGAVIHFGSTGIYEMEPETATDEGILILREIADSYDMMEIKPEYNMPDKVMECVVLSLHS